MHNEDECSLDFVYFLMRLFGNILCIHSAYSIAWNGFTPESF